jgi:Putative transposase
LQVDGGRLDFFGDLARLREPAAFVRHRQGCAMSNGSKRPFARTTASPRLSRALAPIAPPSATAVLACDNGRVHFRWKDYRANGKSKVMTLDADEFIRRFLLHTRPKGFRRIRHFGFPANAFRAAKLARIRTALDAPEPAPAAEHTDYRERYAILTGHRIDLCPVCAGRMVEISLWPCAASSHGRHHGCDTS